MALSVSAMLFHLIFLATIFYTSGGFIPFPEILFAACTSIYLLILSRLAFPPVTPTRPPTAYSGSKLLKYYVSVGALVGLALPLLHILVGFFNNQQELVQSAVPHTALLVFQIISEGVFGSSDSISLPVRAFVPISHNAWRLFTIWSWIHVEFAKGTVFGRFVAVANMCFWSFNLFCFLLPAFLPLAMRKHYELAMKQSYKA